MKTAGFLLSNFTINSIEYDSQWNCRLLLYQTLTFSKLINFHFMSTWFLITHIHLSIVDYIQKWHYTMELCMLRDDFHSIGIPINSPLVSHKQNISFYIYFNIIFFFFSSTFFFFFGVSYVCPIYLLFIFLLLLLFLLLMCWLVCIWYKF